VHYLGVRYLEVKTHIGLYKRFFKCEGVSHESAILSFPRLTLTLTLDTCTFLAVHYLGVRYLVVKIQFGLYKRFFYCEAVLHESIILSFPRLTLTVTLDTFTFLAVPYLGVRYLVVKIQFGLYKRFFYCEAVFARINHPFIPQVNPNPNPRHVHLPGGASPGSSLFRGECIG